MGSPSGSAPAPWSGSGPAPDPDLRLELPSTVLGQLRVRAEGAYPEECCGFLIGRREGGAVQVRRELPCPNAVRGPERQRRFVIHPRALLNVMRALRGREESVVGFYHSHPDADATLSATDMTFVGLWPDTAWLVVPVGEDGAGEERAWWLPSAGAEPPLRELTLEVASEGAWT